MKGDRDPSTARPDEDGVTLGRGGVGQRASIVEWITRGEEGAAFRGKGATRGQPGLLAVPSAPIQLYFSVVNAYIVTFVNGELSEGHVDG